VFEDRDSNEERADEQEQLRKELHKYEKILKDKELLLTRQISSAGYP
jgi:hypothetical protein